jgi:hypothetical protein
MLNLTPCAVIKGYGNAAGLGLERLFQRATQVTGSSDCVEHRF